MRELFTELYNASRLCIENNETRNLAFLGSSGISARIADEAGDTWYGAQCYAVAYKEQVQRVLREWSSNKKAEVDNQQGSSQFPASTPSNNDKSKGTQAGEIVLRALDRIIINNLDQFHVAQWLERGLVYWDTMQAYKIAEQVEHRLIVAINKGASPGVLELGQYAIDEMIRLLQGAEFHIGWIESFTAFMDQMLIVFAILRGETVSKHEFLRDPNASYSEHYFEAAKIKLCETSTGNKDLPWSQPSQHELMSMEQKVKRLYIQFNACLQAYSEPPPPQSVLKPKAHTAIRGTRDDNLGYVGLISYGQTCYVNSVIQQIFMNQGLVKKICLAKVKRSKLYQESVNIFEALQSSSSRTIDPGNWIEAACDELGMHQSLFKLNDPYSFMVAVQQLFYQAMKRDDPVSMRACFGGTMVQQYCYKKPCGASGSVVKEELTTPHWVTKINVTRVGGEDQFEGQLIDHLAALVRFQAMIGNTENWLAKYTRVLFDEPPPLLVIELGRYRINENLLQEKVNTRIAFPLELDLWPYCKSCLSRAEDALPATRKEKARYMYKLGGVTCHSGSHVNGHHFAIIRDRESDKWFEFNDQKVTAFDIADLEKVCFGGRKKYGTSAHLIYYDRIEACVASEEGSNVDPARTSAPRRPSQSIASTAGKEKGPKSAEVSSSSNKIDGDSTLASDIASPHWIANSDSIDSNAKPASQGPLCHTVEIENGSKGSQRDIPTSNSVEHDSQHVPKSSVVHDSHPPTCPNIVVPCDLNTDPRVHPRLTLKQALHHNKGQEINSRQTENESVKPSSHREHPDMPQGIRDTASVIDTDNVCFMSQTNTFPTNPGDSQLPADMDTRTNTDHGHSELPSDMAPRANIISAHLNSPAEARLSVGISGKQGGTMRGSPPTAGGSFSVDSGGSFSVGNIGHSLPGVVSVSRGVTPETMTGLPILEPVISAQLQLCSDSPRGDIDEGCLLTPGARPNSLSTPQFSIEVTVGNGCDNTSLGDPGRAFGQPVVEAASPAPAMAMVWAADNSGCDNTSLGDPGRACGQPVIEAASPAPAMAMVWAADNSTEPFWVIDPTSPAEPTGKLSLQNLACGDHCDEVARIRVVRAPTVGTGAAAETQQRMLYTNKKCKTEGCLCDARHGIASLTCHPSCSVTCTMQRHCSP